MAQVDPKMELTRNSPMYRVWCNMKNRCYNRNVGCYPNYGGRGIKVCAEWSTYAGFYEDMARTFKPGLQLDRINNEGDYSKSNCKWSTRSENTRNTRRTRFISYAGMTKCVTEWAEYLGIKVSTFKQRYYVYQWPLDKLIGAHLGSN